MKAPADADLPACDFGASITDTQRATIRQLEREEVCAGRVVDIVAGCGWALVRDDTRQLVATVDRAGNLLGLDGPGRRRGRSH